MERQISESDWRIFRQLHPVALERFCERVLSEVGHLASDSGKTAHERYLAVYKLIQRRDKDLANTFHDPRRSEALLQLARIEFHGLLTEQESARFSSETRDALQPLLEIWRR
jgi:hypothetical protein